MSPEWRAALVAAVGSRRGTATWRDALARYCAAGTGDIRARYVLGARDDAEGGRVIGLALRIGGWNGLALDDVDAAFTASDMADMVAHYLTLQARRYAWR